jgi:hypothetical protein
VAGARAGAVQAPRTGPPLRLGREGLVLVGSPRALGASFEVLAWPEPRDDWRRARVRVRPSPSDALLLITASRYDEVTFCCVHLGEELTCVVST